MTDEYIESRSHKELVLWVRQLRVENKKLKQTVTLRDQFAMAALQGLLVGKSTNVMNDWYVHKAYQYADEMLNTRAGEQE